MFVYITFSMGQDIKVIRIKGPSYSVPEQLVLLPGRMHCQQQSPVYIEKDSVPDQIHVCKGGVHTDHKLLSLCLAPFFFFFNGGHSISVCKEQETSFSFLATWDSVEWIYHNLFNLLLMNVRFPVFCCYSDSLEPKVIHICAGYSYKLNPKSEICTN